MCPNDLYVHTLTNRAFNIDCANFGIIIGGVQKNIEFDTTG